MYHRLAEILGRHAAGVFKTMSGLEPDRLEIVEALQTDGPRYPVGVRVDFLGNNQANRKVSGFFICAFETFDAAKDIAVVIAKKMGVLDSLSGDDLEGVDNVLGEFLNIIIGLTCSDWSDHGLTTEFDPPEKLVLCPEVENPLGSRGFHLTMTAIDHPPISFFLVLLPESAAIS
ncbi:MAG: hypothetical protein LBE31_02520 [Deltaproteobacteria bacterium]|nr:hypothetical protein [Deltaproteobacteria bacterium]